MKSDSSRCQIAPELSLKWVWNLIELIQEALDETPGPARRGGGIRDGGHNKEEGGSSCLWPQVLFPSAYSGQEGGGHMLVEQSRKLQV